MGESASDTQREIGSLRSDMTSAVAELQRRLQGGVKTLASGELRVAGGRTAQNAMDQATQVAEEVRENPSFLGVIGTVVVGAVGYSIYEGIHNWRENRKPQNRLKRQAGKVRNQLGHRAGDVRDELGSRVEDVRKFWDEARKNGVLLSVEPEGKGYLRVTGAKLDVPETAKGSRKSVLKNLLWAAMLALFMALGGVLARRAAGGLWRVTVGEDPPSEKK